jgi:arginine decarboxylase-like protein
MTRNGGLASVKARREKKKLREMVEIFGSLKVDKKNSRLMEDLGIDEEYHTRFMQGVVSLFSKANKGDVAAFNAIRDIIGEKPVDETKVTGSVQTEISIELIDSGSKPVEDEGEVDLRRQQEEQLP